MYYMQACQVTAIRIPKRSPNVQIFKLTLPERCSPYPNTKKLLHTSLTSVPSFHGKKKKKRKKETNSSRVILPRFEFLREEASDSNGSRPVELKSTRRRRFSPLHSVELLLGHGRGGSFALRTVIRESFHPLKSETLLRLLRRHQFHRLLYNFPRSDTYTRVKYVCLSPRWQATEHRTSCNHITLLERAAANHPEKERARERETVKRRYRYGYRKSENKLGREREGVGGACRGPVLKPERRLPRIEITANGCSGQREEERTLLLLLVAELSESTTTRSSLALSRVGEAEKRVAGNSFSMTKPYIGGHARIYI